MSDTPTSEGRLSHTLADHEARIAWLELELARIAPKVDAVLGLDGHDVPTPKPPD